MKEEKEWRLKGDNSCDIPVECTGWAGPAMVCPANGGWYLSIHTSTGTQESPQTQQTVNHHPTSWATCTDTHCQSSDLQSWCSGPRKPYIFYSISIHVTSPLFPIRWSERKPAGMWCRRRRTDKSTALRAKLCKKRTGSYDMLSDHVGR